MTIAKLENLTVAFVIYAKWDKYGCYHNATSAEEFFQRIAEEQGVRVQIKKQSGKWGRFSPQREYIHIVEVYGNSFDNLLKMRRAIGYYLCQANRNIGYCHRCHAPWSATKSHPTDCGGWGSFPLCEWCWSQLTPSNRWPYYEHLIISQQSHNYYKESSDWESKTNALKEAVFAGK